MEASGPSSGPHDFAFQGGTAYRQMKDRSQRVTDFRPWLRAAIDEARAAGLGVAAAELEAAAFAAYTTSSEWLGETGRAINKFMAKTDGRLSATTVASLKACLAEIRKVWPSV
jgi:hypothetical protein